MSTHRVNVIRINEIKPHPEADRLALVEIHGYTNVVGLGQFKPGDLAVYIEPDYVVPGPDEHPAGHLFAFLKEDQRRIKARKFRGVYSQGLLIPAPTGFSEGDDVMPLLGITRYDPYGEGMSTDDVRPIDELAHLSAYGMENYRSGDPRSGRRWKELFTAGEDVIVTEKINGQSARYAFRDGRMWVGSRTAWKQDSPDNPFWRALRENLWIRQWCMENPTKILYGEIYTPGKKYTYGLDHGVMGFRAFDIYLGDRKWQPPYWLIDDSSWISNLKKVPVLYNGPFDAAKIEAMAEQDSTLGWGKHLMEGVVIKPMRERIDPQVGRVMVKLISNRYLEKG